MNVSGVGGASGNLPVPQRLNSIEQPTRPQASRLQIPQDTLEISEAAKNMANLQALDSASPERAEMLARIKSEIEQGIYDTDEKMEQAFMKFMQQSGD